MDIIEKLLSPGSVAIPYLRILANLIDFFFPVSDNQTYFLNLSHLTWVIRIFVQERDAIDCCSPWLHTRTWSQMVSTVLGKD